MTRVEDYVRRRCRRRRHSAVPHRQRPDDDGLSRFQLQHLRAHNMMRWPLHSLQETGQAGQRNSRQCGRHYLWSADRPDTPAGRSTHPDSAAAAEVAGTAVDSAVLHHAAAEVDSAACPVALPTATVLYAHRRRTSGPWRGRSGLPSPRAAEAWRAALGFLEGARRGPQDLPASHRSRTACRSAIRRAAVVWRRGAADSCRTAARHRAAAMRPDSSRLVAGTFGNYRGLGRGCKHMLK